MSDENILIEKAQNAWENVLTLFLIVIGLGSLSGLVVNLLSNRLAKAYYLSLWLGLIIAGVFLAAAVISVLVYGRGLRRICHIEIALPFRVSLPDNSAEIVIARPYPVTRRAHECLDRLLRQPTDRERLVKEWGGSSDEPERPYGQAVIRTLDQVLDVLVLNSFRGFGQDSLSDRARYSHHGWQEYPRDTHQVAVDDWPTDLRSNPFFGPGGGDVFRQVLLPHGVGLQYEPIADTERPGRHYVVLNSPSGSIRVGVSPFGAALSGRGRDGQILAKYCGQPSDGLWMALFTLQVSADFKGLRTLLPSFRKSYLPWFEALIERLFEDLDWRRCLESDCERMLAWISTEAQQPNGHPASDSIRCCWDKHLEWLALLWR